MIRLRRLNHLIVNQTERAVAVTTGQVAVGEKDFSRVQIGVLCENHFCGVRRLVNVAAVVIDHRRGGKSSVGPAQSRRHFGMPNRKAFDVHFVNDGAMPRGMRRTVCSPGEGRINDDGFEHARSTVTAVKREVLITMPNSVPEM